MGLRVPVRDAVATDARELAALWASLLAGSSTYARTSPPPTTEAVRQRIEQTIDHPERRLLVAVIDDAVAGAAYVARELLTPMHDSDAVRISYLRVFDRFRRQGAGHALLEGAAAWAAEIGVDHIVVDVASGDRDSNRFYARLGMSPLIMQRSAPVAVVRRRLAADRASEDELLAPLSRLRHRHLVIRNR